jgi:hypothetical protein
MPAVVGAGPVGLDSAIVGAVAPGVPMSGVPMPGAAPGVQAAQAPGAVGCATGPAAADEQIPAGHSSAPGGSDWAPRSATTAVRPAPCPSAPQVEEAGGRPGDAVSAAAVSAGAPVPGPVGAASGDRPGDVARAVAVLDGPAVPGPVGAASDGRPDDTVELAGGPVAGALPVPCPPEPAGAVAGGGLGDAVSPAAVVPAGGPVAGALATSRPPVSAGQVAGGGPGDAASAPVAGDGLPVPDDGRASAGPDTAALPAVSITAELVGWMASELPGQAAAGLDAWVHGPAGPEPTQTRRDVPAPRADAESARDDKIGPLPWLS